MYGRTWRQAITEKTVKINHLCQYKTYTIGPLSGEVSGVGDEAPVEAVRLVSCSSALIMFHC